MSTPSSLPPSIGRPPAPVRRIERVRFELRRRALQVQRVERPTPGFARITLAGPELEGFQSLSFDDHVKLMLPQADGAWLMRDVTPSAHDAARGELQVEIALHGHGPASRWAATVQAGDAVHIGGPRGSMILPPDWPWQLLAGDASALPAIARRLVELPEGLPVRVLLQVDAVDMRPLPSAAQVQLTWVHDSAAWLAALRDGPLPSGEGFVWCAGEAQVMAQARQLLLTAHRHPREQLRVAAYWKRGAEAFHERLDG